MVRRVVRRIGVGLLAMVAGTLPGGLRAQTASPTAVHVEIKSANARLDAGDLRDHKFVLTTGATRVRLQPAKAKPDTGAPVSWSTHMLLLLPGLRTAEVADTVDALRSGPAAARIDAALRAGWSVQIVTANGWSTPYVRTPEDLRAALSGPSSGESARDAALDLSRQPGRKVLVVGRGLLALLDTLPLAADAVTDRYVVDGGLERDLTFTPFDLPLPCLSGFGREDCGGRAYAYASARQASQLYSPGEQPPRRSYANAVQGGVWHERTLADALQQSHRDAGDYVELVATLPAGAPQGGLQIRSSSLSTADVHVQAYTQAAGDANWRSAPVVFSKH